VLDSGERKILGRGAEVLRRVIAAI